MTKEKSTRSPIVSILGHVDHGKSSILDSIRESNIVAKEAGAITQAIGASIIPLEVIQKKCGSLLNQLKMKFSIPGLLFIDTPGHAAFTSLRKRGGALADIAILVVDINEGFKPQTIEAIDILRKSKTPFIIAANKLDLVPGYLNKECALLKDLNAQHESTNQEIDNRLYKILGQLFDRFQINAERFDRVDDYTKQIAIVPCSAKLKLGLAELLMVLTGMAQRYMEQNLKIDVDGFAKGTILEVKEQEGMGKAIDVIMYDGTLNVNDTIVIGGVHEPIVTKVRALFQPAPLHEMMDKKSKFVHIKKAVAATGVRISAPHLEDAVAGMPLLSCAHDDKSIDEAKEKAQREVKEVLLDTGDEGIIIKTDSLGSLEAVIHLFGEKGIMIRKATLGAITKKDMADAESNYEQDPFMSVIIGFNVELGKNVEVSKHVKIITGDIIYKLLDDYLIWVEEKKKSLEAEQIEELVRPCKFEILQNCIFRQSNPAVVGIHVLAGVLKSGTPIMKTGIRLTEVKSIQLEKENLSRVEEGKEVAVSLPGVMCGRQINEHDILYSAIPEQDFKKLKKLKKYLTEHELIVMKEIAEIMRKENVVWGV
ncbi:MAG: translation initiation factor IF-2 [Nanoarchaeota archaeon]|nr:translation initiation factor IF-2 [Nanoarchaeota archaeon]MBU1320983.1 translation initiation factor IF-2 [Nanoarchaeota archaeon]MBU1598368.1 translation initiation factor IF-2 [Nanoarchaeota archaeon]MBU2441730.1 translation initiation factor IF-2 [Nanoarchaeota archaeon]